MAAAIPIHGEADLVCARHAGLLAAKLLATCASAARPGTRTRDLDDLARVTCEALGTRSAFFGYCGYPAQACISINDTVIHGIPGDYVIEPGDVVSLDVGTVADGFVGDNALTIIAGGPSCARSEDDLRLLEGTQAALAAGIAAARPGNRVGDISHAVEKVAVQYRLSIVREYVGHGCGRKMHEEPQIPNYGHAGRGPILKKGMVICIEPMLNLGVRAVRVLADGWTVKTRDGRNAAHFEHMIAITDGDPEILTPRQPVSY